MHLYDWSQAPVLGERHRCLARLPAPQPLSGERIQAANNLFDDLEEGLSLLGIGQRAIGALVILRSLSKCRSVLVWSLRMSSSQPSAVHVLRSNVFQATEPHLEFTGQPSPPGPEAQQSGASGTRRVDVGGLRPPDLEIRLFRGPVDQRDRSGSVLAAAIERESSSSLSMTRQLRPLRLLFVGPAASVSPTNRGTIICWVPRLSVYWLTSMPSTSMFVCSFRNSMIRHKPEGIWSATKTSRNCSASRLVVTESTSRRQDPQPQASRLRAPRRCCRWRFAASLSHSCIRSVVSEPRAFAA